jgi:DNA adenine methylase
MVVISGYNCQLYDDLFGDWMRVERKTFADGAKARTEVLWLNENAAGGLKQSSLFSD